MYVLLPVSSDPVLRKMMKLDVSVTKGGAMFDRYELKLNLSDYM
jgi:hypothetical protein